VAVIKVFSGSFCDGEKIADGVAARLRYRHLGDELLDLAAERFGVSRERLVRTLQGPPPFLNKLTHERAKSLACLRVVMADAVKQDNVVYHGFAGHLVPRNIPHVLRVCVIANLGHRVALAGKQAGLTEKQALKTIHKDDGQRLRWTRELHGNDPYEASLYDLLLAMQSVTVESCVESICEIALGEELRTTPDSLGTADDFLLAARVELALAPLGYDAEVTCSQGEATISLNRYVSRLESVKQLLEHAAKQVSGVSRAHCVPGAGFVPPSLLGPTDEFERPSKILLVDDEQDFVHTLSERLQARDLEAAVVYDGESALSFVESDEPEVMVLDLKMPGIDGIEVLRRVKQSHPNVDVIILTGHGSAKEEALARQLGAFAYLNKPVDIELLTKTMRQAYLKAGKAPPVEPPDAEE
jgi:two-component system response regulator CpxR